MSETEGCKSAKFVNKGRLVLNGGQGSKKDGTKAAEGFESTCAEVRSTGMGGKEPNEFVLPATGYSNVDMNRGREHGRCFEFH